MSFATATVSAFIRESAMLDWLVEQHQACPGETEPFDQLPVSFNALIEQYVMLELNCGGKLAGYDVYVELRDMHEHVDHLASLYYDEMVSGELPYYYYYIATRFAVKLRESMLIAENSLTKKRPDIGHRSAFCLDTDDEAEIARTQDEEDDDIFPASFRREYRVHEAPDSEYESEYEETLEEFAEDNGIVPASIRREYRQYEAAQQLEDPEYEYEPDYEETLEELAEDNDIVPSAIRKQYRRYEAAHSAQSELDEPESPPPLKRCEAVRPEPSQGIRPGGFSMPGHLEWAEPDIPDWAVMDDDDDDDEPPTTTPHERTPTPIYDEYEHSSAPSLFRFDPEIPMTTYLYSEENAELFMVVMFERNEWRHSDIVPDRLYNYLPAPLREHVDAITQLLGLGWGLRDNIPSVQAFINNTPGVRDQIDDICNRIKGYLFEADFFAHRYVGRFILLKTAELIGNKSKHESLRVY